MAINIQMARLSVVVNSYNYGQYVGRCIQSILDQSIAPWELIVVDDGSTDDSLSVFESFRDRIKLIRKENGGQASAFNTGFNTATGEWVWFVDADDWIKPDAVEKLLPLLDLRWVKIQFPLQAANGSGTLLPQQVPSAKLSSGMVLEEIKEKGGYTWPPTTGNIFNRNILARVMPIPEMEYRLCADLFVCTNVIRYGEVKSIDEPLAFYRLHGMNNFHGFRLDSGWLYRQFENLKKSDELSTSVVRDTIDPSFEYRFNRRNIELLILAQRFGNVPGKAKYDQKRLIEQWESNPEVMHLSWLAKLKARIYLAILRWGSGSLIQAVQRKNA